MTAPAPGFPPELETAIAQALAEHHWQRITLEGTECGCEEIVQSHKKHLAAVVMEVIAQHTTTEWGYALPSYSPGFYARSESVEQVMEVQRLNPDIEVQIAFRPTFPWQEVKA